jgi:hypothetical protein
MMAASMRFARFSAAKFLASRSIHSTAHPLAIDLTLRSLPGFAMASGTLSPMRNRHTPALLDNDDVVLVVMQSGVGEVSQYGRVAMVNEGEAVLTTVPKRPSPG